MTWKTDDPVDWTLTTWKGSRRRQHQQFHELRFSRKLELIEEMTELAERLRDTPVISTTQADSPEESMKQLGP